MAWRQLLWWSALLANAAIGLLVAALCGALLWAEPEERRDALIVFAFFPAPVLAIAALAVCRPMVRERLDTTVFS